MKVSVVICTYNPHIATIKKVLDSLASQSLDKNLWELIVVDNCSSLPLFESLKIDWHPFSKIIVETNPGLSHARIAGIRNSQAELIVFVDDDNVLEPNYLEVAYKFSNLHSKVGCFGGKSLPVFATTPPEWFEQTGINLGCQDYGNELYISNYKDTNFQVSQYPEKAPIGTGMVILKKAFATYLNEAANNPKRMQLGRNGKSLSSGEDNDIILSIVRNGFEIAYVPDLIVHHLIPESRYSREYLERMAYESNRSWVKVLEIHGMNPHKKIAKWGVIPRSIRSFIAHRAWTSPLSAIRWKSSCGIFKGLSEI